MVTSILSVRLQSQICPLCQSCAVACNVFCKRGGTGGWGSVKQKDSIVVIVYLREIQGHV